MENTQLTKTQSNIIFIIVLLIIAAISWGIFTAIDRSDKKLIKVVTLPSTAKVFINDVASPHDSYITPGTYTIRVEDKGFANAERKVVITEDDTFSVALAPESDDAKKWIQENGEKYGEEYNPQSSINPILVQLPLRNILYTVTAENEVTKPTDPLTLNVTAFVGYKNAPIDKIRSMGYDPTDYNYKFNSTSPF